MRVQSLFLAILAAGAMAAGVSAQTERSPNLRLVSSKPFVVAGTGFRARERVTVSAITVVAPGPRIVRVRASASGSFRARFTLFTQPCAQPYAITARGASGTIAVLPLQASPCVPPPVD
jgi:hypothetical protein